MLKFQAKTLQFLGSSIFLGTFAKPDQPGLGEWQKNKRQEPSVLLYLQAARGWPHNLTCPFIFWLLRGWWGPTVTFFYTLGKQPLYLIFILIKLRGKTTALTSQHLRLSPFFLIWPLFFDGLCCAWFYAASVVVASKPNKSAKKTFCWRSSLILNYPMFFWPPQLF